MITILSLVFLISFAGGNAPDGVFSFRHIPAGDTVTVMYETRGCFHYEHVEFKFYKKDGLTVEAVSSRDFNGDNPARRAHYGPVQLSDDNAAGLDRLLAFYRGLDGSGGCTTHDHIMATYGSGSAVNTIERFDDATCSVWNQPGVTTFDNIMDRLRAKP